MIKWGARPVVAGKAVILSGMTKKSDLDEISESELIRELARRRAQKTTSNLWHGEEEIAQHHRQDAKATLDALIEKHQKEQTDSHQPCPRCGTPCRVRRKNVARKFQSAFAKHEVVRHYHYCDDCKDGFYPMDEILGLPLEGQATSRLESIVLDVGLHAPYQEASQRLALHHGLKVSERFIRKVIERIGDKAELRANKLCQSDDVASECLVFQVDGSMVSVRGKDAWRETKLGMVYPIEEVKKCKSRGFIEHANFVAELGDFEAFSQEISDTLVACGLLKAKRVAIIGDGAPWVWSLADMVAHQAIEVLDIMHAFEHACTCASALFEEHEQYSKKLWIGRAKELIMQGHIATLLTELEQCVFGTRDKKRKALMNLHRYYTTHQHRMRYNEFRKIGIPCASGSIESAHRHVLQKRMKLAGQHWDPKRANKMAKLRAALASVGPRQLYPLIHKQNRIAA